MYAVFKPTAGGGEVVEARYIAVDVGKRCCQACVTYANDVVSDEFVFENAAGGMQGAVGRACWV